MLANERWKGLYQGALSKAKWLGSRERRSWDLVCEKCPEIAKARAEVPARIKEALNLEAAWIAARRVLCFLFPAAPPMSLSGREAQIALTAGGHSEGRRTMGSNEVSRIASVFA